MLPSRLKEKVCTSTQTFILSIDVCVIFTELKTDITQQEGIFENKTVLQAILHLQSNICVKLFLDINECEDYPCHQNATCTNSIGSFECDCNEGFNGTGFVCEGKISAKIEMKLIICNNVVIMIYS
jgi:hypothetical protein